MSNSAFQQRQTGNASETAAGSVEQATAAQVAAKTDVGETGAPLFVVPSLIPTPQETIVAIKTDITQGTYTTETEILSYDIPANTLVPGTYFVIESVPTYFATPAVSAFWRPYVNGNLLTTSPGINYVALPTDNQFPKIEIYVKATSTGNQQVIFRVFSVSSTSARPFSYSQDLTEDDTSIITIALKCYGNGSGFQYKSGFEIAKIISI